MSQTLVENFIEDNIDSKYPFYERKESKNYNAVDGFSFGVFKILNSLRKDNLKAIKLQQGVSTLDYFALIKQDIQSDWRQVGNDLLIGVKEFEQIVKKDKSL